MGLYGDLSYAKTESDYVDPGLDQFFKASTAIQTKHDVNSAKFDALAELNDNLKNTIHNSPAEQEAARKIMEGTDVTIKESVTRGDFANLDRELRKASRDFTTKVKPLQDNYKAIQEADKLRQSLGADALDFTPSENFATYNPDGTTNRFVADVQKRGDYNGKMRSAMALVANTKPQGIEHTHIKGMLQHGSIETITDKQVRDYARRVFDAYTNNTEYKQQKRELMELTINPATGAPYTAQEADWKIEQNLFDIGSAQVHTKETQDFKTDALAIQEAENAGKAENQPMVSHIVPRLIEAGTYNADGTFGTTFTDEDAKPLFGNEVDIDLPGGGKTKGVLVSGPKQLSFTNLDAHGLDARKVQKGITYFDKQLKAEAAVKDAQASLDAAMAYSTPMGSTGYIDIKQADGQPATNADTPQIAKAKKALKDAQVAARLAKEGKELRNGKEVKVHSDRDIKYYKDNKASLGSQNIEIGAALQDITLKSVVNSSKKNNARNVDGTLYTDMLGYATGAELKDKLTSEQLAYLRDNGYLVGKNKDWWGHGVADDETYEIKYTAATPSGHSQRFDYDKRKSGANSFTIKQAEGLTNQYADLDQANYYQGVFDTDKGERDKYLGFVKTKLAAVATSNPAQYREDMKLIKRAASDWDSLSGREQQEVTHMVRSAMAKG